MLTYTLDHIKDLEKKKEKYLKAYNRSKEKMYYEIYIRLDERIKIYKELIKKDPTL